MQANLALRKGLGAVVGLNFDMLEPALQVKMMRPMTITRYKKVRVGGTLAGSILCTMGPCLNRTACIVPPAESYQPPVSAVR